MLSLRATAIRTLLTPVVNGEGECWDKSIPLSKDIEDMLDCKNQLYIDTRKALFLIMVDDADNNDQTSAFGFYYLTYSLTYMNIIDLFMAIPDKEFIMHYLSVFVDIVTKYDAMESVITCYFRHLYTTVFEVAMEIDPSFISKIMVHHVHMWFTKDDYPALERLAIACKIPRKD